MLPRSAEALPGGPNDSGDGPSNSGSGDGQNEGGNDHGHKRDCDRFCERVFPPGSKRDKCKRDAAKHKGLCYECGPAAPEHSKRKLCGTTCCDRDQACCKGACLDRCPRGRQPDPDTCECKSAGCKPTEVVCGDICCPTAQRAVRMRA